MRAPILLLTCFLALPSTAGAQAEIPPAEPTDSPDAPAPTPSPEAPTDAPTAAPPPIEPPPTPEPPIEQADALATYVARRLQRGIFFGPVETWGTGLLFWHGSGAGPLRRTRLLEAFGSVEAIRVADPVAVAEAGRYQGPAPYQAHRVEFLQTQLGRPARGGVVVPSSWNVLDGYGAPMSPRTLALRVGAWDVLERIDREAEILFALCVGAAIGTTALVSLGSFDLRATDSADSYPTAPPPVLAHQAAARRRRGTALVVAGGAISTAAASAAVTTAVMHTKLVTFWTEDGLDEVIQRYNEGLQADLGLSAEDVGRYVRRRGVAPRVQPGLTGVVGEF